MKQVLKQDKGQAGLSILLSIIVMLFIIGLIVTIFALMGSELQSSTYTSTTVTVVNETITTFNDTVGDSFANSGKRNAVCSAILIINATSGTIVPSTNYTVTGCLLQAEANSVEFMGRNLNATYSYVFDADNTATDTMNNTVSGIANVTDWFGIFIVITAMVVLILLTVIIITAIRSSGMIMGGSNQANTVGTA